MTKINNQQNYPQNKPSCFGNHGTDICMRSGWHTKCSQSNKCLTHQNIHQGECDCKYKACCHTTRQYIQNKFPLTDNPTINDCWFYQRFEARLTPEEKNKYPWKEE